MNKKGFTLVELLAVIAILAILVLVAVPNVLGMFNNAKKDTFATETKDMIRIAQQQYLADFGKWNSYAIAGSKTTTETLQFTECTSTVGPTTVVKKDQNGNAVTGTNTTTYCKISKDAGNLTNFIITFEPSKGDVKTVTSTDGTYKYNFNSSTDGTFDAKSVVAQD